MTDEQRIPVQLTLSQIEQIHSAIDAAIVDNNFEGTQAEADELRDMLEAIANEHYVDPEQEIEDDE